MGAFLEFAELCDALAATTKKLEKRLLIAEWLKPLSVEDAARGSLYLAGQVFAAAYLMEACVDRIRITEPRTSPNLTTLKSATSLSRVVQAAKTSGEHSSQPADRGMVSWQFLEIPSESPIFCVHERKTIFLVGIAPLR
jgi:hypothetical protein